MSEPTVVVLGAGGQLGRALLARLAGETCQVRGFDHRQLDITDAGRLGRLLAGAKPDWVVNCAAYTDVQRAEREPDRAFAVNRDGAMLVARYCARRGARLIHVSTDFVFDGRARRPYDESHPPAPANIYGASKLAGELEVLRCCPGALIVRTSWLYGLGRINFVEKVLAQARAGAGLSVVSDQRGRPTYAADLADAIWRLRDRRHRGIVHFANSGICSWFELAQRVLQRSGFDPAQVRPIRSDQLAPGQPPRPSYSALGLGKYRRWTGGNPPAWKPALDRYLAARRAAGFAETAEQIA